MGAPSYPPSRLSSLQDLETEGPSRVYPGGLLLTRSIGNTRASDAVIETPDVTVTDLVGDGARLVIATNGLWGAVGVKEVILHGLHMLSTFLLCGHLLVSSVPPERSPSLCRAVLSSGNASFIPLPCSKHLSF